MWCIVRPSVRHTIVEKDVEAQTGVCSVCGPVEIKYRGLTKNGTQSWACRPTHNERERLRAQSQPEKTRAKWHRKQQKADGEKGVVREQMLADQDGKCAICGAKENPHDNYDLHLDHCHRTGRIRGILCHNCNVGLGHFRDDPDLLLRAVAYIQKRPG